MEPFNQPVNPNSAAMMAELSEKQKRLAHDNAKLKEQVITVFCNPHGLQLLDTLEEVFLRQPVCPPGCIEGYGHYREGENQLVLRIRKIVNNAMKQEMK